VVDKPPPAVCQVTSTDEVNSRKPTDAHRAPIADVLENPLQIWTERHGSIIEGTHAGVPRPHHL
jgi:hypothetical protein